MFTDFFKTYTRKCPDGTKHTLYRNIDDALFGYQSTSVVSIRAIFADWCVDRPDVLNAPVGSRRNVLRTHCRGNGPQRKLPGALL